MAVAVGRSVGVVVGATVTVGNGEVGVVVAGASAIAVPVKPTEFAVAVIALFGVANHAAAVNVKRGCPAVAVKVDMICSAVAVWGLNVSTCRS